MTTRFRFMLVAIALAGCEVTGGGGTSSGGTVKVTESGTKRGSAGGFSARLAAELGPPEGSLGAAAPGATTSPAASGSNVAMTVQGSAAGAATGSAGATGGAAGSAGVAAAAGSAGPGGTTAGAAAPAAGSATTQAAASSAGSAAASGSAATSAADVPVPAKVGKRAYVKPPAELAAIRFDLEPNWERDVGEAGTFSLVVKLPNSDDTRVFSARYGYEDPSAPFDCDGYRKFLETKQAMKVTLNRQRGGACYIESTEKGVASFRYLVSYGGKLLLCRGSLYKDPASSALGDLRDKVLMQAKKICETVAL